MAGKNSSTRCGGLKLPLTKVVYNTGSDRTKVKPEIEGRHYGIPTRRFTILSEKTDRGAQGG